MSGWRDSAKCVGTKDPEMFFPAMTDKAAVWKAIEFCSDCVSAKECREYGRLEQYGTWGGDPRDKKPLRELYEDLSIDEMKEAAQKYRQARKERSKATIDETFGDDERAKYAYRMYKQWGVGK